MSKKEMGGSCAMKSSMDRIFYKMLTKAPIKYAVTGTFNNFNPNTKTNSRIDYIFLTSDFKAKKYGVHTDTYRSSPSENIEAYQSGNFPQEVSLKDYTARLPSDHFPVMITISFPE